MSWLDEYQPLTGVRLNMIANQNGQFVGPNGSSRDISNVVDRELILRLRAISDVYVTGGNTFRNERYRVPRNGNLAVITNRASEFPPEVIALGPYSNELAAHALTELKHHDFKKILLEVGPKLAQQFLRANLIDEFCLTVPGGTSEEATEIAKGLGCQLNLMEVTKIDETLFTRWRRGND